MTIPANLQETENRKQKTASPYSILHTESSRGWGGQERRILAEAEAMRARGHRLLLAVDPRGSLYPRALRAGFPTHPVTFGGSHNFPAWLALRRLIQGQAIDILNTHSSLDSWVGLMAWKTLRPRPQLVRTRHLSTPVHRNWPTRWLYRTPAAIITTGAATKKLLVGSLGLAPERIFSIPTGISLEEFRPRPADPDLRAGLQIPPEAFIFGTVSVLRSWKGHLYLLEALKALLAQGGRAYLVVVGDGPYLPVIRGGVQELGLTEWVRLVGYQEPVAPWLALMDAVVLPSYANEGVPQALLQALAMGKPVIGAAVGGIPEVIRDGETGFLVPPRDPPALARAMHTLMENPAPAHDLAQRGRALVEQKYSLEQMAAAVEAVYDKILLDS